MAHTHTPHFYFQISVNRERAQAYRLEKLQNNFLMKSWSFSEPEKSRVNSLLNIWRLQSWVDGYETTRGTVSEHHTVTAGKQNAKGCPHIIPPWAERSRGQKERVEPATLVRGSEVCCWWCCDEELEVCSRAHASKDSSSILTVEQTSTMQRALRTNSIFLIMHSRVPSPSRKEKWYFPLPSLLSLALLNSQSCKSI